MLVTGNPKAAGTSLRWWLLQTHGVDVDAATRESLWGESAPFQVVWDPAIDLRFTWPRLDERIRAQARADPEVLWVLPIRHPLTRVFSAWAAKYLVLEPGYHERLPAGFDEPPETIDGDDHVRALFERFVAEMARRVDLTSDGWGSGWSELDVHFWPQCGLLSHQINGTSLLLRQEAPDEAIRTMRKRLSEAGLNPGPMPRMNESVVRFSPHLVSARAARTVARLYAPDFAAWAYEPEPPDAPHVPVDIPWLNDVRGRNRRYAVVRRVAVRRGKMLARLREELTASRDALARAEQRASSAEQFASELQASRSWRVTRPLRWGTRTGARWRPGSTSTPE